MTDFLSQIKDNYLFLYNQLTIDHLIIGIALFFIYLKQIKKLLTLKKDEKPNNIFFSFIPVIGVFYLFYKQRKIFKYKKENSTLFLLNNLMLVSFLLGLFGFFSGYFIFFLSLFILFYKINDNLKK